MGRLACLIAAICLWGCASAPEPAPDPGMSWFFSDGGGEGLKLAYGPPNTDDVPVMLSCQPKSGTVRISAAAADMKATDLELISQGVRSKTRARLVKEDLGPRLEADAPARLATFTAFAETGALTVGSRGAVIPTRASDPAAVRRFFEGCGG
jgi:hypothetical protein